MTNSCQKLWRTLVCLAIFAVPLFASAQGFFETGVRAESEPNQLVSHQAALIITSNQTDLEYGMRIFPPQAANFLRLEASFGRTFTASPSSASWRGGPINSGSRIALRSQFRPQANFLGALQITFFARIPGSTTDLFSTTRFVSVGVLPPPTLFTPVSNETLGAAPAFNGRLTTTYVQNTSFQIEVSGPTNRTFTVPSTETGTNFTFYVPLDGGLQPGNYTWRTRTLDARGRPGPWSNSASNTVYGGIDMAGFGSQTFFNTLRNAGWASFFQAAWGGRNIWPDAAGNLIRANNAGYKVAAYAFLNFDNGSTISGAPANQTGAWQVDQGLRAIGYVNNKNSLPFDLKYFMIDLENRFQGTMPPQDRVQRIAEAVQRVRNLGFWPMIYTRNEGFNQWWNDYTGSSADFREMYLWDSKPETATAVYKDHLSLNLGVPWVRYGGWEERGGKQYLLDVSIAGGRVDFNVWDPAVWAVNSPNPGFINITPANVTVVREATNDYKVTVTLRNTGDIEAYAVRLGDASLGGQPLFGRQSLGMITPNGSRAGNYTFPSASGAPGSSAFLQFTIWTGNGPQIQGVWVNLP